MPGTPDANFNAKTLLDRLCLVAAADSGGLRLDATARRPGAASPAPEQEQPNASGPQPLTLTEQVIRDVLEPLQRGIEEHDVAQVLAVFDQQETPDYAQFRDQMRAFFSQNETVRFRYKVLQVTVGEGPWICHCRD